MLCCSFMCGLCLGLCYDVFRLARMWIGEELPPSLYLLRDRLALPSRLRFVPIKRYSQRSVGRISTVKYIILLIEDIMFCLLCAVTLILLLYQTNDGRFRLSAMAMLFGGITVYLATVGRLIHLFSGVIIVVLRAVIVWTLAVLAYPIAALIRWLGKLSAPLRYRMRDWVSKHLCILKEKFESRKQARIARRAHKKNPDESSTSRPPNGRYYFASGKQRE